MDAQLLCEIIVAAFRGGIEYGALKVAGGAAPVNGHADARALANAEPLDCYTITAHDQLLAALVERARQSPENTAAYRSALIELCYKAGGKIFVETNPARPRGTLLNKVEAEGIALIFVPEGEPSTTRH